MSTLGRYCTARQCSPLRRKFMECSINSPALSLSLKHLVIGQRLKTPNFSAFHWSPRGSLVSIGQHFVATRVVHLPKSTETSLIAELDQKGPNHQLLQLCTARIAWSDSDQAVWAVYSCNSWFMLAGVNYRPPPSPPPSYGHTIHSFNSPRLIKTSTTEVWKWYTGISDHSLLLKRG